MQPQLILVDENDSALGGMEKMEVHISGALHRAFSVFIFNSKDELLLQKRAIGKYHCGGLWTNTCCSHPNVGEGNLEAAHRRLFEEMGMFCVLEHQFLFKYYASFENGLIEHEIDHVFFGTSDKLPILNPAEADDYRYLSLESLEVEIKENPAQFTPWLRICLERVMLLQATVK